MADLEKLIRDKQDRLRGRPRDWIDDVRDWYATVDWLSVLVVVCAGTLISLYAWLVP